MAELRVLKEISRDPPGPNFMLFRAEMQLNYQNRSSSDLHPPSEVQNALPPKKVASWKAWDVKPNTLLNSHQFQSPVKK
uniref:Uncharacterized protein n=1 Tax=Salix viminalis TaxID=40686 RepID=A0A6N2N8K4_SALVM